MPILIKDIRVSLEEDRKSLTQKICKRLRVSKDEVTGLRILRESIDARKKNDIYFNYAVEVTLRGSEGHAVEKIHDSKIEWIHQEEETVIPSGSEEINGRIVVVGTGPAGLFAGFLLASYGYRPLLLERGVDVDQRTRDVHTFWKSGKLLSHSNVQFGEGGAGTFSDGKLTTRIKDPRCGQVLEIFVDAGAPEEICYTGKAHIGTDILKNVVKNIRNKIIEMGGEFRFHTKVEDLKITNGRIAGVITEDGEYIEAGAVVLAIGHSARDTYEMLAKKQISMSPKPFAIGLRIEHPQSLIDQAQYGKYAGHPRLGAADYKLTSRYEKNNRAVYSFCMCPGGMVVAGASEENQVVTNGMSEYARDGVNANSALVVSVHPGDYPGMGPLAGIHFQKMWEKKAFELGGRDYHAPLQRVDDFLKQRPSEQLGSVKPTYEPGVTLGNLWDCLPSYVSETLCQGIRDFDRKIKGFAMDEALLTGVETRTSAPLRIERDKSGQACRISGLYPAGEGAGYAGGIISAAVDGMKTAEEIIKRYKPVG